MSTLTHRRSRFRGCLLALSAVAVPVFGQTPELLPKMVVLSDRLISSETPLAEWDRDEMKMASPRTIDEMLAREPSFSLYRRQSSIFGNPTSAGVSLRNTGATAASRTLLLLDGIPQNDPFGGWIYWARHDPATMESIRLVPSARATVWGNQSPAGVIQMDSLDAFEETHILRGGGGSQGTLSGSTVHQMANAQKTLATVFSAFGLHTDGFYAVDSSQRGTIDRKLDTDLYGGNLGFAWLAAPGLTVQPTASCYHEERGNGTPLTGNSTEAMDLALRITSVDGNLTWQALAYHQRREFEAVFSSLDEDRENEVLALDQFDVPGRGTGGALTMRWDDGGQWTFTGGLDSRHLSGETNEDVGTFRRREAGGNQTISGLFGAAGYQIDANSRINASGRIDAWQLKDGRRIETSLSSGSVLRADDQDDRDGIEPSASVEYSREVRSGLESWISAGTAIRLPTINELHRPFRVRNDIVEANPDLDPERFVSIEAGIKWEPEKNLSGGVSLFQHWISDAIANVPITNAGQITSISQRQNVEQAQVCGIEAQFVWLPADTLTLGLNGLWSQTDFTESESQPLLEGKPFPQAPELRLIASAEWRATGQLTCYAGFEYGSRQYDDSLAAREISDYTSMRVGVSWQLATVLCHVRIENLFDEQIQTGLSSDGIRSYAAPRSLWAGVEWQF